MGKGIISRRQNQTRRKDAGTHVGTSRVEDDGGAPWTTGLFGGGREGGGGRGSQETVSL